jgi:hypothetical protein
VNVTFGLLSAEQFVQAMQELSLLINMTLNKVDSIKRAKILEAITDELNRNYKNKKTGLIRLTNETISITGQKGEG